MTLVVSLSWVAPYTFTPASDRPYIDGSTNNSAGAENADGRDGPVDGHLGVAIGWLFPLTLLALLCGLWWWRAERTEPVRGGLVMWGVWLRAYRRGGSEAWLLPVAVAAELAWGVSVLDPRLLRRLLRRQRPTGVRRKSHGTGYIGVR